MKNVKRFLSVLLVLALCAALLPTAVFADTNNEFRVVALGDSSSNGFGLDDYGVYSMYDYVQTPDFTDKDFSFHNCGFFDCGSRMAYPARLARYIQEQHPEYDVKFTNLAISGIRGMEIRALLDGDYAGDHYSELYRDSTLHFISYTYGVPDMHELFTGEVQSADLITFDGTMNHFTEALLTRLGDVLAGNGDIYAEDTVASLLSSTVSPEIRALAAPMQARIRALMSSVFSGNTLAELVEAIGYAYVGSLVSFSETVKCILALNPDVQLLVGGAFNPFYGEVLTLGGIELDIGSIINMLVGSVNTYITTLDPNRFRYSYIELTDDVETYREYLAQFDTVQDIPVVTRSRLVDDIFDLYHTIASLLCDEAREEAAAKLPEYYDPELYAQLYAQDIDGYLNRYFAGEKLDPVEQIFADKFLSYLEYYLVGAKVTKINLPGLIQAFSVDFGYGDLFMMRETPADELSDYQKASLYLFMAAKVKSGAGVHPSVNGCNAKYEAAVKAYNASAPATVSTASTVKSVVKSAVTAYKTTVSSAVSSYNAGIKNLLKLFR